MRNMYFLFLRKEETKQTGVLLYKARPRNLHEEKMHVAKNNSYLIIQLVVL